MSKKLITPAFCVLFVVAYAPPAVAQCPFQTDLIAGQHTDAGDVLVWIEDCTLVVKYVASGCWRITETHLHVAADLAGIPQTKKGNPIPGQFDYQGSHPSVTEVTYQIPLGSLCGGSVCIAAHAVVMCGDQEETAWGDGIDFPGRNWAMYFCLTPPDCPSPCPAPQLLNGGFETPEVEASAGWDIFNSGTAGLGWTVQWAGGSGQPAPPRLELQEDGVFANWQAHDGDQWAELDTDWDGPSGSLEGEEASVSIHQSINTCPGRTYKVTFWYAPRPGWADNRIKVYWDLAQVGSEIVADGTGDADNTAWTQVELPGLAASAGVTTLLAFVETGTPDSLGMFLDDVSVELEPLGP